MHNAILKAYLRVPCLLSRINKTIKIVSLCYLRRAVHLTAHPHHRQQLQQVLREGQDRGGDTRQEEEGLLGGRQERYGSILFRTGEKGI